MKKTIRQAMDLFESFRERKPRKVGRVKVSIPDAVAVMGYVEGIDYRTTHGRETTLYHHDFAPGSRPLLCVSADGRQLLLLGGRYRWTERGIVDHDHKGREIESPQHGQYINPRDPEHRKLVADLSAHFDKDEAAARNGNPKAQGFRWKGSVPHPNGGSVDTWYDRRSRSWITQRKDDDGNQIGAAEYTGNRESAMLAAQEMLKA